jgi:hypothetical protein
MPARVVWVACTCSGGLVFGAEPADVSVAFFGGAFGVEGDEAFEDGFGNFGVMFTR